MRRSTMRSLPLVSWLLVSYSLVVVASTVRTLRFLQENDDDFDNYPPKTYEPVAKTNTYCHDPNSFLGVGNTKCIRDNWKSAMFLLAVIILVSIVLEKMIHWIFHLIHCPQLKKIVNRIFEEVMMLGFLSMVIFTLNTSGIMKRVNLNFDGLSAKEQLYFFEFFHYVVFLTMIYFILIVLLLLFTGTVMPKLIWKVQNNEPASDARSSEEYSEAYHEYDDDLDVVSPSTSTRSRGGDVIKPSSNERDTMRTGHGQWDSTADLLSQPTLARTSTLMRRVDSGMDLVRGSRAYNDLQARYQREGWSFRFNLCKQWHLWKSFEVLAYNICQNRSGYIYKNPTEMERLFGVKQARDELGMPIPGRHITYERYHELCMRNLLFNISHLHYSAFFILVAISMLPTLYAKGDHYIFIAIGCVLLMVNVVIMFKVSSILRGIVHDRLRIITQREIELRMHMDRRNRRCNTCGQERRHGRPMLRFRAAAMAVRAIIRMQNSALCHRQLHHHDNRFWFNSPKLLLRLFQFATIGQAFYLVWLSLVEIPTTIGVPDEKDPYLIIIMVLLPFLALFVITPMTMPSLVLIMGLTGIFVDLNANEQGEGLQHILPPSQTRRRIRTMRKSYLRSAHSEPEPTPMSVQLQPPLSYSAAASPTSISPAPISGYVMPPPSSVMMQTTLPPPSVMMPPPSSSAPHHYQHPEKTSTEEQPTYDLATTTAAPTPQSTKSTRQGGYRPPQLLKEEEEETKQPEEQRASIIQINLPPPVPVIKPTLKSILKKETTDDNTTRRQTVDGGMMSPVVFTNAPRSNRSESDPPRRHSFSTAATMEHSFATTTMTERGPVRRTGTPPARPPPPPIPTTPVDVTNEQFATYCSKYGGYPEN